MSQHTQGSLEILGAKLYWDQKLAGLTLSKLFPFQERDLPEKNSVFTYYELLVNDDLVTRLQNVANNNEIALNSLLLTALKILIYKCTGQQDIVVTSPVYGTSKLNRIIPLRDTIRPDMTLKAALFAIRQTLSDGYKYQYYPWHRSSISLKQDQTISEVMLVMGGIHDLELLKDIESLQNSLTIVCKKHGNGLKLQLIYNRGLGNIANAFLQAYVRLLQYMVFNFENTISECCLFERNYCNHQFKKLPFSTRKLDKAIHQRFEEQVSRTSANIAARMGEHCITYNELNLQANHFARVLRSHGITREQPVAIVMSLSINLLIAIFSVLKSGGYYTIIDPSLPPDHIENLLKEGQCFVVTNDLIEFPSNKTVININKAMDPLLVVENLACTNICDDLACILYVQDSSQKLYRVMIEHGSAIDLLDFNEQYLGWNEQDQVAMLAKHTSIEFFRQMLLCLLTGATLNLTAPIEQNYEWSLESFISEKHITTLMIPSIYLNLLNPNRNHSLKKLIVIGDIRDKNLIEQWHGKTEILYTYGPSEVIGYVATCNSGDCYDYGSWVIGYPAFPYQLYIIDPDGQLQANGLPGKLVIMGNSLSRNDSNQIDVKTMMSSRCWSDGHTIHTETIARQRHNGAFEIIGGFVQQMEILSHWIELFHQSDENINQIDLHKEIKEKISAAWKKITNIDVITTNRSFLELGGNSIQILKLVAELHRLYPGKISAPDILAYPTIDKLAHRIAELDLNQGTIESNINNDNVHNIALLMPKSFFKFNHGDRNNNATLSYTFTPVVSKRLAEISKTSITQEWVIIAAAYIHSLSLVSGENVVNVQTIDNKNNFYSVKVNLKEITDFNTLSSHVDRHLKSSKKPNIYALNKMRLPKESTLILPMVYDASSHQFDHEWLKTFDMILGIRKEDRTINITLRYNRFRLNSESIGEWLRKFIHYVGALVENLT
ncbi:AMP-binding protein [Paenibacillus sp. LMG 31461]|uniref:AMP-binding protein n=1 Tax=Paenibacillus plantarum TaxID=2654975 RepID=A0ABX1X4N2_9BACL|nr:AMP-binding protein [Paenibacillus plantarum]NOU63264.1 AMP-binding protein [Paenibacillus plantarum]